MEVVVGAVAAVLVPTCIEQISRGIMDCVYFKPTVPHHCPFIVCTTRNKVITFTDRASPFNGKQRAPTSDIGTIEVVPVKVRKYTQVKTAPGATIVIEAVTARAEI